MKSRSLVLNIICAFFLVFAANAVHAAGDKIKGEAEDKSHQTWSDIQSLSRIEAPQGAPAGTRIVGGQLVVQDGYLVKQVSDTRAQVMKRDGGVTGTVTCDPCKGSGACTLSSSGGKLGCTSTCDSGCVTVIKIPLPRAPAMQLNRVK